MNWTKIKSVKQAKFFLWKGFDQIRYDEKDTRERKLGYVEGGDLMVFDDGGGTSFESFFVPEQTEMLVGNSKQLK